MIAVTQVFEFLVGSKADIDALDAVSDDKFGKVYGEMFQRLGRHLFTLLCAGEASRLSSSSSEKRFSA